MLLIYLPETSSRSKYVFDKIFMHEFGIKYRTTSNIAKFESHSEEKINYSYNRIKDEFFIKASSLLFENTIINIEVPVKVKNQIKVLFPNNETCDVGFDIFSSVFYMLSRYEEYLPFTPDKHGRFKATDTLAYKNNFLYKPVADIWINYFKNVLQKTFPALNFISSHFDAVVTYDIDVAYKYKGRAFKRAAGATLKDLLRLDFRNIQNRVQTLYYNKKDPWDTYDYLEKLITSDNLHSIFFFLLGDKSKHDRNLDFKNPDVKKLIHTIKSFSEIGIHPSYKTSSFPGKFSVEKTRLENLSGKTIQKSRQHFLKFTLPGTYNNLIKAGITEDYSMGFPYTPGFRAGTSKPFYFYDLKNERSTSLKIFPVTFMEGNFAGQEYSNHEKILEAILDLIREVKNVNGTFISIWHNHSVSETREFNAWRNIHAKMIEQLLHCLKK